MHFFFWSGLINTKNTILKEITGHNCVQSGWMHVGLHTVSGLRSFVPVRFDCLLLWFNFEIRNDSSTNLNKSLGTRCYNTTPSTTLLASIWYEELMCINWFWAQLCFKVVFLALLECTCACVFVLLVAICSRFDPHFVNWHLYQYIGILLSRWYCVLLWLDLNQFTCI